MFSWDHERNTVVLAMLVGSGKVSQLREDEDDDEVCTAKDGDDGDDAVENTGWANMRRITEMTNAGDDVDDECLR